MPGALPGAGATVVRKTKLGSQGKCVPLGEADGKQGESYSKGKYGADEKPGSLYQCHHSTSHNSQSLEVGSPWAATLVKVG